MPFFELVTVVTETIRAIMALSKLRAMTHDYHSDIFSVKIRHCILTNFLSFKAKKTKLNDST